MGTWSTLTNGFLFYFLLRRIELARVALIGAIAFVLFPADTTHILLMHALGLHTSLTFLLIASHCYLSGRKTLAYVLSLGSLLTYESPYMVFLAVPLLCRPWDRKLVKEMIRHVAVWLGILLAVVAIRAVLGEGRSDSLGSSLRRHGSDSAPDLGGPRYRPRGQPLDVLAGPELGLSRTGTAN